MMWPFTKNTRKSDIEVDEEQRRADVARRDMDAMHKRLEEAVNGLLGPQKKEVKND